MLKNEDFDDGEIQVMNAEVEEEAENEGELSVMSLQGLVVHQASKFHTMRLRGKVQGVPILLLIDSGATHNFISHELVAAMGWGVANTTPLQIKLGDGAKTQAQGECKGVLVDIGQMKVEIDALLFDLDGIDIVLGMAWLNSTGSMWVDWPKQLMRFRFNNRWVELKGESSHEALQSLLSKSTYVVDGLVMSFEGQPRVASADLTSTQEEEVQQLLTNFAAVFREPRGLPPKR